MTRRRHRSLVVSVGDARGSDGAARALASALGDVGIETRYLGQQSCAREIALSVVDAEADAVELCLTGGGGVALLRDLLRELTRRDRRGVSIVVHRVR